METISKNIIIKAPRGKIFDYFADPMTAEEWSPALEKITKVTGEGVGLETEWIYKMFGLKFSGKSIVRTVDSPSCYTIDSVSGIMSSLVFTLENYQDSDTKLNLDIEYTIPIPVLGKLLEKVTIGQNKKIADQVLSIIKTKMEG